MKKNSILVTGCAGFIGSNFTNIFSKRFPEITIVGIDDLSAGLKSEITPSVHFYEGSICDSALLDTIFKKYKPQYVFHFAALPRVSYTVEHPKETTDVNVGGTVLLLEKSRDYKIKRFIFSSTSAIYGNAKHFPTSESENMPDPLSPYAAQKLSCEYFCKISSDLYGVDTVCLRYFNVFGPGQYGTSAYSTVVSAWLTGLYFPKKKKAFIEGDGKQTRDFVFVESVVEANIQAMLSKKNFSGKFFNIGDGTSVNLLYVKKMIEKHSGKKLELLKHPTRVGDARNTLANISLAKKHLGYKPVASFEEGLKKQSNGLNQGQSRFTPRVLALPLLHIEYDISEWFVDLVFILG